MSNEFIHGDEYSRGCVPGNSFSNLQYNKPPEGIEERFPRYEFFSNPFCEIDIHTFYAQEDVSVEDICEHIIPKDKAPNISHESTYHNNPLNNELYEGSHQGMPIFFHLL